MTKTINIVAFFCLLLLGFSSPTTKAQSTKFPIPVFSSEQRARAAERLKASMGAVRAHLCQKPVPVTAQWQQEFDELLITMIVSEHNLVWVTGGRFSLQESADERRFFTEKNNLVKVFERAVEKFEREEEKEKGEKELITNNIKFSIQKEKDKEKEKRKKEQLNDIFKKIGEPPIKKKKTKNE